MKKKIEFCLWTFKLDRYFLGKLRLYWQNHYCKIMHIFCLLYSIRMFIIFWFAETVELQVGWLNEGGVYCFMSLGWNFPSLFTVCGCSLCDTLFWTTFSMIKNIFCNSLPQWIADYGLHTYHFKDFATKVPDSMCWLISLFNSMRGTTSGKSVQHTHALKWNDNNDAITGNKWM